MNRMKAFITLHFTAIIVLFGLMFAAVLMPAPVEAASPLQTFAAPCSANNPALLSIPPWYHYLQCDEQGVSMFSFPGDIWLVVIAIIEILIKLTAYLAVILIIYAGINMIISQGNPEKINGAKGTIEQALIGLGIAILAVTIIRFVGDAIGGPVTS